MALFQGLDRSRQALLQACLSCFILDYVARQKQSSTHMNNFVLMQLAVPSPTVFAANSAWTGQKSLDDWVTSRVEALRVFQRDEERALRRCELDAAFFHIYGVERDDVDYIMETFPIVKRKDIAAHGEYRTKRMILEIYDAMLEAEATGIPYASPFDKVHKQ